PQRGRVRPLEALRQGAGPRPLALLHRRHVQPGGDLAEAARAVRGGLAHRAAPAQGAARAHPRRAERRRQPPRGRRGDLPAGDVRRDARRGRRAGDLRQGPDRARRALPGRGDGVTEAELDRALAAALEAAHAAGEVAMRYYRSGFDVTMKADATPVTEADRGAERVIREVIGKAFPGHGFLGEEFGAVGDQRTRWIIDPIDGTRNFIRHVPIWATLIGLEDAGEITVGVIHNPVTGELLAARRGGGAWL